MAWVAGVEVLAAGFEVVFKRRDGCGKPKSDGCLTDAKYACGLAETCSVDAAEDECQAWSRGEATQSAGKTRHFEFPVKVASLDPLWKVDIS